MKREYKFFFAGAFILLCLFVFLFLSEKKSTDQTAPKKEKTKKTRKHAKKKNIGGEILCQIW